MKQINKKNLIIITKNKIKKNCGCKYIYAYIPIKIGNGSQIPLH